MLKQMLEHQSLDRIFHALSDPSRRAILERLGRGDASVSELARPLAMSLAAVVQHVQALEASGLIRTAKVGRVRSCQLDRHVLSLAEQWLTNRRAFWEAQLDRLGELLAEPVAPPAPSPAASHGASVPPDSTAHEHSPPIRNIPQDTRPRKRS
jgi:DNA-binding transcriptional ArsR family regulator